MPQATEFFGGVKKTLCPLPVSIKKYILPLPISINEKTLGPPFSWTLKKPIFGVYDEKKTRFRRKKLVVPPFSKAKNLCTLEYIL